MKKLNILVIDDDAGIRMLVAEILRMNGHEVHTAEDVGDGLEILKTITVDCLISDCDMSYNDEGLDVMKWANDFVQSTGNGPIGKILMSGRHENLDQKASLIGAIALPKPFKMAELVAALEKSMEATEPVPA